MKRYLLILALFSITSFDSISQLNLYAPRAMVVPVHTDVNQLHISGGYAISRDQGGMDVNLSYTVMKNFAAFVGVTYNPFSFKYDGPESFLRPKYHYKYNNISSSFGMEYYKSGLESIIDVFEAQLGAGFSSLDRYSYSMLEGIPDSKREYSYSNVFAQLSVTKTVRKFEFSIALRATHINFGELKEYDINQTNLYTENDIPSKLFFEPSLGVSYSFKGVKLNLQAGGYSSKFTTSTDEFESTSTERQLFSRIAVQYNF